MDFFNDLKDSRTLEKCQKILSLFEELEPRKLCARPQIRSELTSQYKYHIPISKPQSRKNSVSNLQRNQNTPSRSTKKQRASFSMSSNSKICWQNRKSSEKSLFQRSNDKTLNRSASFSIYKKQSRLERIMGLKVKPTYLQQRKQSNEYKRQAMTSYMSSQSPQKENDDKENLSRNRQPTSRLDKIMKIKVNKPQVNSTLRHYKPRVNTSISSSKIKRENSRESYHPAIQLRECKRKINKAERQEEKEDRLWKVFERERDLRLRQSQKRQEKGNKDRRRKEKKFEGMIDRELIRIQTDKQSAVRKNDGFSAYLYPSY